jgi:hypothetical protein
MRQLVFVLWDSTSTAAHTIASSRDSALYLVVLDLSEDERGDARYAMQ